MFARLTPVSWAGLTSQAVYSPVDNKFIFANVGANIFDPRPIEGEGELFQPQLRPPHSASVFYQFNTNGAVENLNLATTFRINNHLAISYLGRFDGESGRFLENWAGFRVISDCDCWVFDAAFVDRVNPDEVEFRFRFSLVGLGTFGQSPFAEFGNAFPTPTSTGPEFGALYEPRNRTPRLRRHPRLSGCGVDRQLSGFPLRATRASDLRGPGGG